METGNPIRNVRVLYAEDSEADILAFEHYSKKLGYPFEYLIARSFKEAVELLGSEKPDVLVTDYFLGDGSGLDLLKFAANIPSIIITGGGTTEIAVEAMKAGAADYLIKDMEQFYLQILPRSVLRSIEEHDRKVELERYRTRLEELVAGRTRALSDLIIQVQESETNFRNIFNCTGDSLVITDQEMRIIEVNQTLIDQFKTSRDSVIHQNLMNYISPQYKQWIADQQRTTGSGLPAGHVELELKLPENGTLVPVEINSVPIVFNRQNAILTIIRDISERWNIRRRLIETIIQTEEAERHRIAKDLHDEIGPLISAIKIYLTSFLESASQEKKDRLAEEMGLIVKDMIDLVKNISNDMSPHILVNFGLLAAIQNIADLFSKSIRIHIGSSIGACRFPGIVESVIYRIVKELINNTIKHAEASDIFLELTYMGGELTCTYRDNGVGFDWPGYQAAQMKGMGLSNIQSRIQSLGGTCQIHSAAGKGFKITLALKTEALYVDSKETYNYPGR